MPLSEKTLRLESLPLDRLTNYLDYQRRVSGENIELFGAKIPAEVVALWGLPLIIIVQLYFLNLPSATQEHRCSRFAFRSCALDGVFQ